MVEEHGMVERVVLTPEEHADELLLMGLQLAEGFDPKRFENLQQRSFKPEKIKFLEELGFLETLDNGKLRATPAGFLLLDAVVADLAS